MKAPEFITDLDMTLVGQLAETVDGITITNDETASIGQGIRDEVRRLKSSLNKRRLAAKKPFKDIVSEIDSTAKVLFDRLLETLAQLDKKLSAYVTAVETERVTTQLHNMAPTTTDKPIPPPAPIKTRTSTQLQITDETLIPKKYWVIDESAVRKDLLAGIEVPGAIMQQIRRLN